MSANTISPDQKALLDEISFLKLQLSQKNKLILDLYEKLKLQRHRQFGKKSEKEMTEDPQSRLFDETELPANEAQRVTEEEILTVPEHQRSKKSRAGRKPLPENLERVRREYDIPENKKTCDCGCVLTCIGETVSEQLNYAPAKVYVIQHARKKYACKTCEETIKEAKLPAQPIAKSIASPGLLSYVCISKFEDYLPLYRQERMFQRIGVDLPRASLSNWVIRCADLLLPLYKLLQDRISQYDIASADETRVQVLNEPGREPEKKSYMWVFNGGPPDQRVFLYHYSVSRSHEVAEKYLEGFSGYLHCDGYSGYDSLAKKPGRNITLAGCWYHVRRKFVEAAKVSDNPGIAQEAILFIKKLSKIEVRTKKLTPVGRKNLRNKEAKPLLTKFKRWLDDKWQSVFPQSTLGKAIKYAINQWPKLQNYLEDGRLEFSNNHMERAVKPFVIGRKNWLFANSVAGANAAAIIYSIIETCKTHNVPTYEYLSYVFTILPTSNTLEELEALLPFNVDAAQMLQIGNRVD